MGISSIIILPLIVLFIIIYGFIKKVDIYDEFLNGALDGLKTTIKIIPNLVAMIFAINILIKSNKYAKVRFQQRWQVGSLYRQWLHRRKECDNGSERHV